MKLLLSTIGGWILQYPAKPGEEAHLAYKIGDVDAYRHSLGLAS